VRAARESDLTELVHLEQQAFVSYYRPHRYDAEDFRRYLASADGLLLVAVDPEMVGYIAGRTGSPKRSGRIDSVAVARTARGRGIGRLLLRRFLQQIRREGGRAAWLEVAQRNATARSLFEATGFKPYRRLPAYYGKGADAVRLRAAL
jgi:ribosomal protein S18 acetylase RimI-like enzyme